MNATNKPLYISKDVLDTLFAHALQGYVAQAIPPHDVWQHIAENVQHFPSQGNLNISHIPQVSNVLLNGTQQRL
ncbi:MAG TPA: hypothetical protein VLM78_09605 [Anaerolineales bacterium]|nr:hypothetical protein [Anaerolineales bacterium]